MSTFIPESDQIPTEHTVLTGNSWVMLHDRDGFIRLPNEHLMYTSPPRTSLSLQPLRSYTGSESLSVQSSSGSIYLTNQRVCHLLFI